MASVQPEQSPSPPQEQERSRSRLAIELVVSAQLPELVDEQPEGSGRSRPVGPRRMPDPMMDGWDDGDMMDGSGVWVMVLVTVLLSRCWPPSWSS